MLIALAAAFAILAQAAPASTPAAPPPPAAGSAGAPAASKPPKPKMICHEEVSTGSIMSRRVCRTPEQIEADELQAKRDQEMRADHLAVCHGGSC